MVDTANDVIADLRAKISECAALGLEALRRLGERDAEVARLTAEVEQLKAMTIEAVKGTSLTIIDAIGGTAQQTIEGRADPEFAEVALRAQLGAARAEVARLTAGDLNAYQAAAATTAMTGSRGNLPYLALGLNGEAGEVAEAVKKVLRDNGGTVSDERKRALVRELGDTLWYLAMMADALGVTLSDVAAGNLEKLADRRSRGVLAGSGNDR